MATNNVNINTLHEIERRLEDLHEIERRLEDKSRERDDEISGMREDLATILQSIRTLEAGAVLYETRIRAIETKPSPGALAFWSPALATAVGLATLMGLFVSQEVEPVMTKAEYIEQAMYRQLGVAAVERAKMEDRQFSLSKDVAVLKSMVTDRQPDTAVYCRNEN